MIDDLLRLLFDLVALCAWLAVRIARSPSRRWAAGPLGKALSLLAVLAGSVNLAGWWLPLGAAVVAWRDLARDDPFELPMADGRRMR